MLRIRWKPVFLFLAVFTLTMGCNGKATTQPITALPSINSTSIKPSDTPLQLSNRTNPSTTTGTPIIPIPTVDLPFTIVRIFPSRVGLSERLAQEVHKADQLGYAPVVEFDAHW